MDKEFLSIKEIAAELKTTKQRVYRCIKKHHISEAHSETVNGNTVMMYDKAAFLAVSKLLGASADEAHEAHHDVHQKTPNDALYEALLKQLEEKDKQIERLQQSLEQSQQLLDQSQKLHALDKQRILELEDKAAAEPEKKKWWFWK